MWHNSKYDKDVIEGSYIEDPKTLDVEALMDGCENDSWYKLEPVCMDREEWDTLPEFMGF